MAERVVHRGGLNLGPLHISEGLVKAGEIVTAGAVATGIVVEGANLIASNSSPKPPEVPPSQPAIVLHSEAPSQAPSFVAPSGSIIEIPSPVVTEAPTPVITAAPIPTTKPENSATPVPTAPATVSPIPSESLKPADSPKPEHQKTLAESLQDWVNGKIKIPDSEMYVEYIGDRGLPDGPIVPLGLHDKKVSPGSASTPIMVGYVLGQEIVENHQIVYMGFEDKMGGHFFVPMNFRQINNDAHGMYWLNTAHALFVTGDLKYQDISTAEMAKYWPKIVGTTVQTTAIGYDFTPSPAISDIQEELASAQLGKDFISWMDQVYNHGNKAYKSVPMTTRLKDMINKRITLLNPSETLYEFSINTHI